MRPRVLYITHRVPFPPDRGDRIRTWNILRKLAQHADVDLACLSDDDVSEESMTALQGVTDRLLIANHTGIGRWVRGLGSLLRGRSITEGMFRNSALHHAVCRWAQESEYDAVLASSSGVAPAAAAAVAAATSRRKPGEKSNRPAFWVDLIDVDSRKWADYSQQSPFPMSYVYSAEHRRLRKLESALAAQADRLTVVSEAECEVFRDFCNVGRIDAICNGVDTEFFSPSLDTVQPNSCVFVGVLNYKPNTDAVIWFADNVWPQLLNRFPDAEFRIVGKSPPAEVTALNDRPGIHVIGPVDDVRPWLRRSAAVVVPLRIARGVQNKVLEAMACARPVVCSPAPLNGLSVESGIHLIKADSPDQWVDSVGQLFTDRTAASEIGTAAGEWVRLHHQWDACLEPLLEMLPNQEFPAGLRTTAAVTAT